jgi:hypothetical protein
LEARHEALRQSDPANRRNATKSTGPTTEEGRRASSRNSLKFDIHISDATLYEDPDSAADIERTLNEYLDFYQPAEPAQRDCLSGLAEPLARSPQP